MRKVVWIKALIADNIGVVPFPSSLKLLFVDLVCCGLKKNQILLIWM